MRSAVIWIGALLLPCMTASAQPAEISPASPPSPGNQILQALPQDAVETLLDRGWHLIDTPGPEDEYFDGLEAVVIFERPVDEVLALLAQTERQAEYRKDVQKIETIERREDGTIDEHRMRIMFVKIAYRIHYEVDVEAGRIHWRLDPRFENSLRHLEGYWELYDLGGGRTLARFGTEVEVGPALPGWMQDAVTRSKLPKSIDDTRKWVNAGGTSRR